MIRKIIQIDEEKCNGCGLCADACHECAIGIVDGKAKLLRDDYCDGMGDCLPSCPMDAISFVEREALPYDEKAVQENIQNKKSISISQLDNWPVQIKLTSPTAGSFENADLLIAADCTAYAYANFHQDFISGKTVLIGCPKLDAIDYSEKLSMIVSENSIKSITVVRMEVPCCGGIQMAAQIALSESGKDIPLDVVTIGIDGRIL